ncbi:MAG: hypothetical protein ACLSA6_04490 [Holdemania massiliensis]
MVPQPGLFVDITNSTAFDQYFVYGRDIFTSISKVVDDIFNEYIRKVNTVNPYYAGIVTDGRFGARFEAMGNGGPGE